MARYHLRRPSPVKIVPRRVRRQVTIASSAPAPAASEVPEAEDPEEGEEEEGPESPDSPFSSPSTLGGSSESEDSESDDDEEQALLPGQSGGNNASSISSVTSAVQSESSWTSAGPAFTISFSSPENFAGAPQVTASSTLAAAMTTTAKTEATASDGSGAGPAKSEITGQDNGPQRSSPQDEKTVITKGGAAAAITVSIISAMVVFIAAVIYIKRRKRLNNQYNQRLADDTFNPNNAGSLHVPETAHVPSASPAFAGLGGIGGSHLTRSSERSESLFGAGPYVRPETVSTDRNKSTFPIAFAHPTPNPFADPPLNKAYDVLAGRPRSTTLTDRGSWVKNPFSNPESERFDPFGELQKKARDERRKYLEGSRKGMEEVKEREVQSQFREKEKMGLGVPERKGSGVTIEGVGILDRSGGRR
ncbi:hypothetical protein BDU57DRAFT_457870 [Ampelomyces quisqualis]|uniref:Uncharacterized protein n=1 Tax=Ampelomyces quisqualis TaxID=50730 RepID=A0A6A5QDN7_AMPQU|nr:hypothetical protein BDU57DRAFT_457870 [Ampelomyces quisqualis]